MRSSLFPSDHRSLLVGALTAPLLFSCSGGGGLGGFLVSDEQEVEIGQSVDAEIEAEFVIAKADDPAAIWAVEMVANMEPHSKTFRDPADFGGFKVELIHDDELVNAFAAPGGFVYITTGLILHAETCGEVAGVVGHELAHVTERHGVKQLEEAIIVQEGLALFVDGELAAGIGAAAYTLLRGNANSQAAESEADDVGLRIAHDSAYNPFGIVVFFQRLLALEAEAGEGPDWLEFLSTHPPTQVRVDEATATIKKIYPDVEEEDMAGFACKGTTLTFAEVRQHITDGKVSVRPETGQGRPEEGSGAESGPAEPAGSN